jgi:hypothetical protein
MPTWVKVLLILVGSFVLLIALVVGAGLYWWSQNKEELIEGSRRAIAQGEEYGKSADNQACLQEALSRYKQKPGLTSSISTKLFLGRCLQASRPTPGFCDDVPRPSEIFKSATWQTDKCKQNGVSDQYCNQIVQQVQVYCEAGHSK